MSSMSSRAARPRFTTVDNLDTRPAPGWATAMALEAQSAGESVSTALAICEKFGADLPVPGYGQTAMRWKLLAIAGEANLTVARVLEAHTDALAILNEAGQTGQLPTADVAGWGVFAAEAPGQELSAASGPDGWTLTGTKPWCSLGGSLGRALVTARVADTTEPDVRQLFAAPLQHPTVRAEPAAVWVSRGLRTVTSGPVHFSATPATPIGAPGWYLRRPGFAWGGIGVAACWFGGALGLAETLRRRVADRRDELSRLSLGSVEVALHMAAATLSQAAQLVDDGAADGAAGVLLALRVRAAVAQAVELTLTQTAHTLGPAPLAFDEEHARRVADLEIYVRQHHAERDLASLGQLLLTEPA
ncbi:hypothetical protein SAMN05892883_4117 [Jatrophihabitans sp. GAS493]|uniref:acyl-CoA/acyl-ACP dehydrogenase n=1 Tax=Jatrophihabitans sp. GAS493 TaxID=1907575 RepID=UPI000BBF4FFB|nr:acyl-CoA/acyl-ACP dehydrogenase [Jatrophihabitans sp. GAS493]SOD74923.1 hypothetical protein SAMN05892883_4117 [Jatrophihabitans sp. GAS493]